MEQDYKSRHKQGKVRRQAQCQFANKYHAPVKKDNHFTKDRIVRVTLSGQKWGYQSSGKVRQVYRLATTSSGGGGGKSGDTRRFVNHAGRLRGFKQNKSEVMTESQERYYNNCRNSRYRYY